MFDTQPRGCWCMVRASSMGVVRSLLLVSILVTSTTLIAWGPSQPLDEIDDRLNVVGLRSGQGVVDVPEWAVGDTWTYDAFFDVQEFGTPYPDSSWFSASVPPVCSPQDVLGAICLKVR